MLLLVAVLCLSSIVFFAGNRSSTQPGRVWQGWNEVSDMFVFGDSYSGIFFNTKGPQPNEANPFGNPPNAGYFYANGPMWMTFLTTIYNQSFIRTYDFAIGGATIDNDLYFGASVERSFKEQVHKLFIPRYASDKSTAKWAPSKTIFAVWFGVNDIYIGTCLIPKPMMPISYQGVIASYGRIVEELYRNGARNFLFLNAPPIDHSPHIVHIKATEIIAKNIALLNSLLEDYSKNFTRTHSDATVFLSDTNARFTEVINDPKSHEATAHIRNTTEYCFGYENGTPDWDTLYKPCKIPINEYFWFNLLHPTYPMHNVTAQTIVRQLETDDYVVP